jgi:hypothetical protein
LKILIPALLLTILVRLIWADGVLMLGDDQLGYLDATRAILAGDLTGGVGVRHLTQGYYLAPFFLTMGEYTGGKLAAVIASVLIAFPAFAIIRMYTANRYVPIIGALALTWWYAYGVVLGYGFAYLMSLALAVTILYFYLRYTRSEASDPDAWRNLIPIAPLSALLVFSNVSAALPLAAVLFMWGVGLVMRSRMVSAAGAILPVAMLGLLSFIVFPTFEYSIVWRNAGSIIVMGAVAGALLYASRKLPIRAMVFGLVTGLLILTCITSDDSRAVMTTLGRVWLWWPIPAAFVGTYWLDRALAEYGERVPLAIAGGMIVFLGFAYQADLAWSLPEHSTLTPTSLEHIAVIAGLAEDGQAVVTSPESYGWHVKRMTGLQVLTVDPLNDDTPAACILYGGCNSHEAAQEYNVQFIVTPNDLWYIGSADVR